MIEQVIYLPEAEDEVAHAYAWYEDREPQLGEKFLRCVAAGMLLIQQHPHLYPVAVNQIRRSSVRHFPFEIFYEPSETSIVIHAVFHCSQDPQKWRSRFGSAI